MVNAVGFMHVKKGNWKMKTNKQKILETFIDSCGSVNDLEKLTSGVKNTLLKIQLEECIGYIQGKASSLGCPVQEFMQEMGCEGEVVCVTDAFKDSGYVLHAENTNLFTLGETFLIHHDDPVKQEEVYNELVALLEGKQRVSHCFSRQSKLDVQEILLNRDVEQTLSFKFNSGRSMVELNTSEGYAHYFDSRISVPCSSRPSSLMRELLTNIKFVPRANIAGYEDQLDRAYMTVSNLLGLVDESTTHIETLPEETFTLSMSISRNELCPYFEILQDIDFNRVESPLVVVPAFFQAGYGFENYVPSDSTTIDVSRHFDIVHVSEKDDVDNSSLNPHLVRIYESLRDVLLSGKPSPYFAFKRT